MDKKRLFTVGVVFLLALSMITFAQEEAAGNCVGLWGSVKCFLWGISNQESVSTPLDSRSTSLAISNSLDMILGDPQVEFMLYQQHYETVVEFNPENRAGQNWWARSEVLVGN